MAFDLSTEESTTNAVIQTLSEAFEQCGAAITAADNTSSQITGQWQSPAATIFLQNLATWKDGVVSIRQGVEEINQAMVAWGKHAANLEETNVQQASWTA